MWSLVFNVCLFCCGCFCVFSCLVVWLFVFAYANMLCFSCFIRVLVLVVIVVWDVSVFCYDFVFVCFWGGGGVLLCCVVVMFVCGTCWLDVSVCCLCVVDIVLVFFCLFPRVCCE